MCHGHLESLALVLGTGEQLERLARGRGITVAIASGTIITRRLGDALANHNI